MTQAPPAGFSGSGNREPTQNRCKGRGARQSRASRLNWVRCRLLNRVIWGGDRKEPLVLSSVEPESLTPSKMCWWVEARQRDGEPTVQSSVAVIAVAAYASLPG